MALPGNGTIPAPYSERLRFAKDSGEQVMKVLAADLKPRDILTDAAVGNALAADASLGCCTNTVLHLAAIATEAGLRVRPATRQRGRGQACRTSASIAPSGAHHMEDLYHAGGIQAVVRQLIDAGLMDGSALTWPAARWPRRWPAPRVADADVIRPLDQPYHATGGLAVLFGNLAPSGAVVKEGASPTRCCATAARRRCSRARPTRSRRSPPTASADGSVVVIRNEGPKGAPGMPEMLMRHVDAGRPGPRQGRRAHHRRPLQRRHARRRHRPRRARGARRRPHRPRAEGDIDHHRHPSARAHPRVSGGGDRAAPGGQAGPTPRAGVTGYLARYVRLVSGAEKGAVLRMTPVQEMKGSAAIVASLEAEGCEVALRLSRRRRHPALRRPARRHDRCATCSCATSRARRTPPTATRARPARSASASPPAAPARPTWSPASPTPTWTRCRSWPSPVRCTGRPDRHRRLPGGRHHRHHPADRQALLPGARRGRPAADHPRGVPHRPHRAAGAGGDRHPGRRLDLGEIVYKRRPAPRPARLQADRQGPRQADPRRRAGRCTRRSARCSTRAAG